MSLSDHRKLLYLKFLGRLKLNPKEIDVCLIIGMHKFGWFKWKIE